MLIEVEIGMKLDLVALVYAYRIFAANVPCNSLPDISVRLNLFMPRTAINNLGFASLLSINCEDYFQTTIVKMSICGMSTLAI
jgi:hypothetical protein